MYDGEGKGTHRIGGGSGSKKAARSVRRARGKGASRLLEKEGVIFAPLRCHEDRGPKGVPQGSQGVAIKSRRR